MREDRRESRRSDDLAVELLAARVDEHATRLAKAIDRFDRRLESAVDELRGELKKSHEDFDRRVDELEVWHLTDTAITGERIAQHSRRDRLWVRASLAIGILSGLAALLGALHVI